MYKALLFALDGNFVTDYRSKTIQEVEERLANQGSKWYFYPFGFVIRDTGKPVSSRQLIIVTPDGFSLCIGQSVGWTQRLIRQPAWIDNTFL